MKSDATIQRKDRPYLYQHYSVLPYYQTSSGNAQGTMHKLVNSLIEALNENNKLPEYILLIPDRDLVLQIVNFVPGIVFIMEQMMRWIGKQFDRFITA